MKYYEQYRISDFIVLHFVKSFFWDRSVLLNTVIIGTYIVWVQHSVFVITIVTGECAILILQKYGLVYVIAAIVYWSTMILLLYYVLS